MTAPSGRSGPGLAGPARPEEPGPAGVGAGADAPAEASPVARRVWVLAAVAPVVIVALALVAVLSLAAGGGGTGDMADHGGTAPLQLPSVPEQVAGHYRAAAEHAAAYAEIPCYCGCLGFLAHRNLQDCFVRPDGRGWEAHAAGCGVCLGESALARRLLDEGRAPAAVREAVIAQFGSTPATAPPPRTRGSSAVA